LLKLSEYRHVREDGVWPNRHVTFIVDKKSLIYGLFYFIYGIGGGGWLKTSYGGRGLAKNVRMPSYGGRRSKISQKTVI